LNGIAIERGRYNKKINQKTTYSNGRNHRYFYCDANFFQ